MGIEMTKQVYDLTPGDIESSPIWVFPMDHSVEDELSVRALKSGEIVPDGLQTIVRCVFRDAAGRELPGYLYPGGGDAVEEVRPVAWFGSVCITFWNGMIEPTRDYLDEIRGTGLAWPIDYESVVDDVPVHRGVLDGLYFFDGDCVRCVAASGKHPTEGRS